MIICLLIATVLLVVFLVLFMSVTEDTGVRFLKCLYKNKLDEIKNYNLELEVILERLEALEKASSTMRRDPDPRMIKRKKQLEKKIIAAQKVAASYQKNGLEIYELAPMAGFRVLQLLNIDGTNPLLKSLRQQCLHFKNEKDAMTYAIYLLSSLIGNLMLSVVMLFMGMGLGLALGMGTRCLVLGLVLAAAFALLGYLPYDNVSTICKKRAASIEHDFPRVVSKLTLLTVSGLELSQAWDLVASSDTGVLYAEMRRVSTDMNNNVPFSKAYNSFIQRCDYSYTTKLATAIMQNMTKGNAEIVSLLRTMNNESWSECKHAARRKGEEISSKLLWPTLLLFAGMLILVLVPSVGGFNLF